MAAEGFGDEKEGGFEVRDARGREGRPVSSEEKEDKRERRGKKPLSTFRKRRSSAGQRTALKLLAWPDGGVKLPVEARIKTRQCEPLTFTVRGAVEGV